MNYKSILNPVVAVCFCFMLFNCSGGTDGSNVQPKQSNMQQEQNDGQEQSNIRSANDDRRLVGTWVTVASNADNGVVDGSTWVFNSDGTGTTSIGLGGTFKYATIAGKIKIRGNYQKDMGGYAYLGKQMDDIEIDEDYVFSKDGKTLFLGKRWMNKSSER